MTWVEFMAAHEQLVIGLVTVTGVAAMALAYALLVVRRGGRAAGRDGDTRARR